MLSILPLIYGGCVARQTNYSIDHRTRRLLLAMFSLMVLQSLFIVVLAVPSVSRVCESFVQSVFDSAHLAAPAVDLKSLVLILALDV